MKVYACGGFGVNIGDKLESIRSDNSGTLDSIDISYIDTSDANLRHNNIPKEYLYLIEGSNGSGKLRSQNYSLIKEQIKSFLINHKPEEFNVVVHSLSGGSGSVIAPIIVNELLSNNSNVIVVAISSDDSTIEIENSIKTIKSYVGISQKHQKPVPMIYYPNDTDRNVTNEKVKSSITLLGVYLNKNNHELDYSDITNFLNYNKVTDNEPTLVMGKFLKDKIDPIKNCHFIAALTIAVEGQPTNTGYHVDYQAIGFADSSKLSKNVLDSLPNHFVLIDGCWPNVIANFENKLNEIKSIKESVVAKKIRVTDSLDDGMVL